jgi:tetratricopeptide (TPR) repeat protein
VLDLSGHPGAPWPLDVVQALRDKSLLRAWEPSAFPGELRFGMYANIREYAAEKLTELGKTESTRGRRADHYLRVGGEWARALEQHGGFEPLERLALDWENLAAVLQRALEVSPPTVESVTRALRAIDVLDPVLSTRGPFGRHLAWLDAALSAASAVAVDPVMHAKVLELRGRALRARGQPKLDDFDLGLTIARASGNRTQEGRFLSQRGFSLWSLGRTEEARAAIEQGLEIAIAAGDEDGQAHALATLGIVAASAGAPVEARAFYDRALALHRKRGNARFEAALLGNLGLLHFQQGRLDEAEAHYRQALEITRKIGDRRHEGNNLGRIGLLALERQRFDEARVSLSQAIAIQREVGNRTSEGIFLGNLGIVELECGRRTEAIAALEAAGKIVSETGERRGTALFGGFLAVAIALEGDPSRAEALLDSSDRTAATLDDPSFRVALGVLRGAIDHAKGDAASAKRRLEVDPAIAGSSEDVRLALRIVARLIG